MSFSETYSTSTLTVALNCYSLLRQKNQQKNIVNACGIIVVVKCKREIIKLLSHLVELSSRS
jgi:hypothetical protein